MIGFAPCLQLLMPPQEGATPQQTPKHLVVWQVAGRRFPEAVGQKDREQGDSKRIRLQMAA